METDIQAHANPTTIYLKDYAPPPFLVPKTSLTFDLHDDHAIVQCDTHWLRNGDHTQDLVLQGEFLELVSVALNGQDVEYEVSKTELRVNTDLDEFSLSIVTRLEPQNNTALTGLYQSSGNFCTQCEAEGFRRITYFLDRPDVLSEYTVTVQADEKFPVLLSNGNPVSNSKLGGGRHQAVWHDPHPKPSYLFALVAGDLQHIKDSFTTMSGRNVELLIYTQAHNIDKCEHAMESLKNAMKWDEEAYGREYDLDVYNIVAVDDFNMGAMENKGLNVFNSKYVLANQQTATDTDFEGIESVIGHEYFHNWSGNRVTCRDWFQLSLKEGFTVFRDQQFSAAMGSPSVKRIRDVQVLRSYQFKEDAGPMSHPVRPDSYEEINNFYTVTIYEKGAEVIRMMHRILGEEGFRKGSDLYFDRHDGQAVTTEDFVVAMEDANGVDLSQFRLWYTQSGTPELEVVRRNTDQGFVLSLKQTTPSTPNQPGEQKEPFHIPLSVAVFDSQGNRVDERTINLHEQEEQIEFVGRSASDSVSFLRDFSAPIKVNYSRESSELLQLVAHDDNGFARWEAVQTLSLNVLLSSIQQKQFNEAAYADLASAYEHLMLNAPQDKAVFAEMLSLPSNAYIAELLDSIDPLMIVEMKQALSQRLARDFESQFHALYATNNHRKEFSLSADAMAERALKNRALTALVASEQAAYHALASHQYHTANNMTDRLAAFGALINSNYPERDMLIEDFYQQWQHDTLVLDKWFAMQALSDDPAVLQRVLALCEHSAFSIKNPNKVRSLIGAFTANMRGFHSSDGAGYVFLADKVLELNELNPQIAARLVGSFNNWRSLDAPYSELMKQQLERIAAVKDLKKDVSEIVGKALA